jgi:hypothetical protein
MHGRVALWRIGADDFAVGDRVYGCAMAKAAADFVVMRPAGAGRLTFC